MGASSFDSNLGMQLHLPGDPREGVPGGPHHVGDGHDQRVLHMVFFLGMHFYLAWHHYQYIYMQLQLPGEPGEGVPGGAVLKCTSA